MTNAQTHTLATEWQNVCTTLEKESGDRLAIRWLKRIVPHSFESSEVCLVVPSPCIHELVKKNYADQLLSLWQRENPTVSGLKFTLTPPPAPTEIAAEPAYTAPAQNIIQTHYTETTPQNTSAPFQAEESVPCFLDKTQTFDSFVVGKPNEFAYAAARRVAEDDSISFNPLYIHASVGLGKTHLMHAIAWRMKELSPDKTILYLSAEQFFQRFIKALRHNNTESFRDLFRTVDVLMIDDVQFIFGKKATQEEFFHTFNTLIAHGKKIILSADSNPLDLQGIEDRLKTRIAQGLVVQIAPTSYELRLGILQEKIKHLAVSVPESVLEFLAKNITASVRELEGALKRIVAHADLIGTQINIETTKNVLKDILQVYEKKFSIPEIQEVTATYYGLPLKDLKSTRRDRRIARPRQLAMYLSKALTALSLPDIGTYFDRDHTTIIHAVRTIEDLLTREPQLEKDKEAIIARLKDGAYVEY